MVPMQASVPDRHDRAPSSHQFAPLSPARAGEAGWSTRQSHSRNYRLLAVIGICHQARQEAGRESNLGRADT